MRFLRPAVLLAFSLVSYGSLWGTLPGALQQKTALVLQNHKYDPMGNLEPVLQAHQFAITVLQLPEDQTKLEMIVAKDPLAPDLVVILGGSPGVYEMDKYPFLRTELTLLQARLQAKRPSFGICLGAQLMAHALGARVYPGPVKELGWYRSE